MRAVILTGAMPWAFDPGQRARLDQMIDLYRGLGCACDLLVMTDATYPSNASLDLPDGVERFGHLPLSADLPSVFENPATLEPALAALAGADRLALVHFDGIAVSGMVPKDPLVVFDTGQSPLPQEPPRADLVLAPLERDRVAAVFSTLHTVRFPVASGSASALRSGRMIGWPGPVDAGLAGAWTQVLKGLAARGERLHAGLLLEATGGGIDVPPLLSRAHTGVQGYRRSAARRALGLGVLPAAPTTSMLQDIVALISQGTPVLTIPDVAALFEDRWHVPTVAEPSEMAERIEAWISGQDVASLIDGTAATREALQRDQIAMTAYVSEVIADRLAERA